MWSVADGDGERWLKTFSDSKSCASIPHEHMTSHVPPVNVTTSDPAFSDVSLGTIKP